MEQCILENGVLIPSYEENKVNYKFLMGSIVNMNDHDGIIEIGNYSYPESDMLTILRTEYGYDLPYITLNMSQTQSKEEEIKRYKEDKNKDKTIFDKFKNLFQKPKPIFPIHLRGCAMDNELLEQILKDFDLKNPAYVGNWTIGPILTYNTEM